MKKKIAGSVLLLSILCFVSGCAVGSASNEYVEISKYKGVEVPKVEGIPKITDDSIENNIDKVREGFAEEKAVTGRKVKKGDIVVLDYTASADGKKIDGASVTDYKLEIGKNSYFEGFEESVIGRSTGETYEIEHTFTADYKDTAVAGKKVVFSITVKTISEKVIPDLTDEFVQTISEESKTVEEYKKEMRKVLEEKNKEYVIKELTEASWKEVLSNSKMKKYPEDQMKEEKQTFYDNFQKGADTYDMEFDEFLKQMDMTEEQFEQKVTESAKSNVKENVVTQLIAEKEGISLSDSEYKKAKKELAKEMGYENVEEMEKEAPEHYIKSYILRDQVKEWVAGRCLQVKSS